MAVDVTTQTEINRPRAGVAAYVSDPDKATAWYENIVSVRWESSPPAKVGSRIAFTARFLGRELAYTYQVQEIVTDERFVMSTAQGPFPMETTYSWEDTPSGGTRMTLRNRGRPTGFARIATPMLAAAMRRANRNDLARLKALRRRTCASSGSPCPGRCRPRGRCSLLGPGQLVVDLPR